jgi:predicted glycoside hydrolase/deacetylase ChbG (UPF0249 family)
VTNHAEFTERAVVVTASDLGLCVGVNEGARRALEAGLVSGASLIVVAPFAKEAVRRCGGALGIQLTLSSEHELLDLRPLTDSPSLLGGGGGFPRDARDAAAHADPAEVDREFRSQIERAVAWGVAPTFLSSHDDVVARELALFDIFLDLAEEYRLPIRHGYDLGPVGVDAAKLARERGHFVAASTVNWSAPDSAPLDNVLSSLPSGVSELIVSPSVSTMESHAVLSDAEHRCATLDALEAHPPQEIASRHHVAWRSWSDLKPA